MLLLVLKSFFQNYVYGGKDFSCLKWTKINMSSFSDVKVSCLCLAQDRELPNKPTLSCWQRDF